MSNVIKFPTPKPAEDHSVKAMLAKLREAAQRK